MKDLDAIYFAARELRPEARPAYLADACGGDGALRSRVEQMLAVADKAEAFITDLPDAESEERKPAHPWIKALKREPPDLPDEIIGQKIGRYKVLERLGEGGCGVVYVAEQIEPVRRRVALKVIKLGMDTKQVVARFEAERQALAMMDHPNIAKVLDAGATEQGRPYFVMELVRGIRITDYCNEASLSTKERLELFIQVCQAIQHAHQKGIIHRDIKPSNILVTLHDGVPVPKVIDFGIAKATEGRLTDATVYTQLHHFIGTPAYMSPEQAELSGLDIDTRSDIYSLGVLLYELLAGCTPFDGKELMSLGVDAMRKTIREKEPLRPSTKLATLTGDELTTTAKRHSVAASKLIHQLKGDLDWIVMKCLEKDRTRRYETANGLGADVKRHLDNEPVVAGPPSAIYTLKKFIVRNKGTVILNATVAALTLAGLIGTSIGMRRATLARIQADRNAARAGQLADEAKKSEVAARFAETNALRQAYAATLLSASEALERGQTATARNYLNNAPAALRGWEWRHLSSRLDLTTQFHERPRSEWSQIQPLPDGRSYYDIDPDPTRGIRRWETDTGRLLETIPASVACWESCLIANRKQMVMRVGSDREGVGSIELWDLEHANRVWSQPVLGQVVYSPDGSQAAYDQGGKVHVVDIPSGMTRVSPITVFHMNAGPAIAFQPDRRRLAVCKSPEQVALLDMDSLEIVSALERHQSPIWCLAFSRDSRLLAAGLLDGTLDVTDVAANPPAVVATLRGHTGWGLGVSVYFSPDGALLASCAADRTVRLWDARTGKPRGVFETEAFHPDFLPDGQTLISGDTKGVRFWDVRSLDAWVLRGHRSYVYPVLLSPDGATIYSGGWDGYAGEPGCLRVWDAATGEPIAATGAANEYIRAAALSHDGSRLAISANTSKEMGNDSIDRIKILDTATGATVASIALSSSSRNDLPPYVDSLACDAALQRVVWIDDRDGVVRLADARTGVMTKSRELPGTRATRRTTPRVAWSPDGAIIAAANSGSEIDLLVPQSLETLRRWPHGHSGAIFSLAFSPDSRRLLTASEDGIVRVWDVATGTPLHDLVGHANRVLCAACSPDGQRIATGGGDNSVRLWDADTFEQVGRLGGHEDYVYALAWRADSQQLISSSGDHTIRIWDTQPLKDRMQARRERQAVLVQVEPKVQQLFAELGDAGKVLEQVKADASLSTRARQIAFQVALRISLDRINAAARPPRP